MNCKRARHSPPAKRLLPKRVSELPTNFVRNVPITSAVVFRQPVFRHPERAKQEVPDRKRPGEIGVAALLRRRVMPAVKDRGGEHVSERAKCPVQIGVDKGRVNVVNGPTQSITLGEMPAINRMTSTAIVPRKRLAGWKRAAEIHSRS